MARSTNPRRSGAGAQNLDARGRVNRFVQRVAKRSIFNRFRRKSNGGMGG